MFARRVVMTFMALMTLMTLMTLMAAVVMVMCVVVFQKVGVDVQLSVQVKATQIKNFT